MCLSRPVNSPQDHEEKWNIPYLFIIAVGFIQMISSQIFLCYGVYLMHLIQNGFYSLEKGLWVMIVFISSYKLTSALVRSYCRYLEIIQRNVQFKRTIIISALTLSTLLATTALFQSPQTQILLYGFFGGILTSIITVSLRFYSVKVLPTRPSLFSALELICRPLSLLITPNFILFLINTLGSAGSQLVISGLVLNIIPACLLLEDSYQAPIELKLIPSTERLPVESATVQHAPLQESSSDDDDDEKVTVEKQETESLTEVINEPSTSSTTVQVYYQNVGVKIMPEIAEEVETDDEDDDINDISSKRLSRISAKLVELNVNAPKKDDASSVNNFYQPDENIEVVEENVKVETIRSCFSLSSSMKFNLRRKKNRFTECIEEHVCEGVPRTLYNLYFYPIMISSCFNTTLSTIYLGALPYIANSTLVAEKKLTEADAAFLLAIVGFVWLFFLSGYPAYIRLERMKLRTFYITGLLILALSLYAAQRSSEDGLVFSCLAFAIGYGIVSYSEELNYEEFCGKYNWKKLRLPLEITTGLLVILTYCNIYFVNLGIRQFLKAAPWLYVLNAALWILAHILKFIIIYLTNSRRYNRERFSDYNY